MCLPKKPRCGSKFHVVQLKKVGRDEVDYDFTHFEAEQSREAVGRHMGRRSPHAGALWRKRKNVHIDGEKQTNCQPQGSRQAVQFVRRSKGWTGGRAMFAKIVSMRHQHGLGARSEKATTMKKTRRRARRPRVVLTVDKIYPVLDRTDRRHLGSKPRITPADEPYAGEHVQVF